MADHFAARGQLNALIVEYDIRYEDGGDATYATGGKHRRIEQIVEDHAVNNAWDVTHTYYLRQER